MRSVPKVLRYFIIAILFFFIEYRSNAQVVCETGYYADYTANGNLLPASITTLRNGQQVITGQANINLTGRMQGMVARISETGNV